MSDYDYPKEAYRGGAGSQGNNNDNQGEHYRQLMYLQQIMQARGSLAAGGNRSSAQADSIRTLQSSQSPLAEIQTPGASFGGRQHNSIIAGGQTLSSLGSLDAELEITRRSSQNTNHSLSANSQGKNDDFDQSPDDFSAMTPITSQLPGKAEKSSANAKGFSMTAAAIRARKRRAREKEERERMKIHQQPSGATPPPPQIVAPTSSTSLSLKFEQVANDFQLKHVFENLEGDPDDPNTEISPLGKRLMQLRETRLKHKRERKKNDNQTETPNNQSSQQDTSNNQSVSLPSQAPISSLKGPDSLIGTQIPPNFPKEEVFLALSIYCTIRTLSLPLRLSPFTPVAFMRGLSLPIMNQLIGEIHVSLLKALFVDIGRGSDFFRLSSSIVENLRPKKVGSGVDSDDLMGSDCLTYMNEATWPLFYVDYVEATQDKFSYLAEVPDKPNAIHLDVAPVPADKIYSRKSEKSPNSSDEVEDEEDDEQDYEVHSSDGDSDTVTEDDSKDVCDPVPIPDYSNQGRNAVESLTTLGTLNPTEKPVKVSSENEKKEMLLELMLNIRRKADVYGFFTRPVDPIQDQCPDYFDVIDPVNEAMDLGTMEKLIQSGEIESFDDVVRYLKRIVMCGRKYNTDIDNFVRKQTERFEVVALSLVRKAMVSQDAGQSPESKNGASHSIVVKRGRGRPPGSTNKRKEPSNISKAPSFAPTFLTNAQFQPKSRKAAAKALQSITEQVRASTQHEGMDLVAEARPSKRTKVIEDVTYASDDTGQASLNINISQQRAILNDEIPARSLVSQVSVPNVRSLSMHKRGRLPTALPAQLKLYNSLPSMQPRSKLPTTSHSNQSKQTDTTKKTPITKHKIKVCQEELAANIELSNFIGDSSHIKQGKNDKEEEEDDTELLETAEMQARDFGLSMSEGAKRMREWRLKNKQQRGGARRTFKNRENKPTNPSLRPAASTSNSDSLPHVIAAHKIQDLSELAQEQHSWISSYSSLPIRLKLEILHFLVEEYIQLEHISAEVSKRFQTTQGHAPAQYLPLPRKEELQDLCNVDDCVVCKFPGDLVCCDGCTNSFHKRCCRYDEQKSLGLRATRDDDDDWLCPECSVVDSSKLGPLHGGNKPNISWWGTEDFDYIIKSETTLVTSLGQKMMELDKQIVHSAQHPQENDFSDHLDDKERLNLAEEIRLRYDLIQSSKHDPDLEYIIVHGLVFSRRVRGENVSSISGSPPLHLSQSELHETLKKLGPIVCSQWPWCQIPFDPDELWTATQIMTTSPVSITLKALKLKQLSYFSFAGSHNPTMYKNLYSKAPPPMMFLKDQQLPKHLYQKTETGQYVVANFELLISACEAIGALEGPETPQKCLPLPELPNLSHDLRYDTFIFQKEKLVSGLLDHLAPVKSYLRSLERMLSKACLMHEHWGVDWTKCRHPRVDKLFDTLDIMRGSNRSRWYASLREASTVSQVGKSAVQLVDSIDTRTFYEEWNFLPNRSTPIAPTDEESGTRIYFDVPQNFSIRQLLRQRKKERSCRQIENLRYFLNDSKEDNDLDATKKTSIGRKGRASKHRLVVMQPLPSISLTTLKKIASSNPADLPMPVREATLSLNNFTSKKLVKRKALKPKVNSKPLQSSGDRFFLQCLHCGQIPSSGIRVSSPKHATKDHYEHIQTCPVCPQAVKFFIATLRSKKELSQDSNSFFHRVLSRISSKLNESKSEVKITISETNEVYSSDIVKSSMPSEKVNSMVAYTYNPVKIKEEPREDLSNELEVVPSSDFKSSPNITSNNIETSSRSSTSGCSNEAKHEVGVNEEMYLQDKSTLPANITDKVGDKSSNHDQDIPKDQIEDFSVYAFETGSYPLVDPSDEHLVTKYIISVYKHFAPYKVINAPITGTLDEKPLKKKKAAKRKVNTAAPNLGSGTAGKKHRPELQRYYVACTFCGEIPSFGIKLNGPQHATKDLFYHLQECSVCPISVKTCVSKTRNGGGRSQNSASFFKAHLERLKKYVASNSGSEMKDKLYSALQQRRIRLSDDLTNSDLLTNFDDSDYVLIKKADLETGSPFFISLYKNFLPVGRNFGNASKDIALITSSNSKYMQWTDSNLATDDAVAIPPVPTALSMNNKETVPEGNEVNLNKPIETKINPSMMGLRSPHNYSFDNGSEDVNFESPPPASSSTTKDVQTMKYAVKKNSDLDTSRGIITADNEGSTQSKNQPTSKIKEKSNKEFLANQSKQNIPNLSSSKSSEQVASRSFASMPTASKPPKVRRSGRVKIPAGDDFSIHENAALDMNPTEKAKGTISIGKPVTESEKKERVLRLAEMEKLLSEPFHKEIHWPICGRLFIPPPGSLPPQVVRYLGRNYGSRFAPFTLYSDKLEVGKPSTRYLWRTDTMDVETVEELYMQIHILDSYLNRSTIVACENAARRTTSKTMIPKPVQCSHRDPATGRLEYLVVSKSKGRACWVPEEELDIISLVHLKRNRIDYCTSRRNAILRAKTQLLEEKSESNKSKESPVESAPDSNSTNRLSEEIDVQGAVPFVSVNKAAESTYLAQVTEVCRKHEQDTVILLKDALGRGLSVVPPSSMNIVRMRNKQSLMMAGDILKGSGSNVVLGENEILQKLLQAESHGLNALARSQTSNSTPALQKNSQNLAQDADSRKKFISKLEADFRIAYERHKQDTKDMLQEASKLGAEAVSETKMNAVRMRNLKSMRDANFGLKQAGAASALNDASLTQTLTEAENEGVKLHVAEENKRRQAAAVEKKKKEAQFSSYQQNSSQAMSKISHSGINSQSQPAHTFRGGDVMQDVNYNINNPYQSSHGTFANGSDRTASGAQTHNFQSAFVGGYGQPDSQMGHMFHSQKPEVHPFMIQNPNFFSGGSHTSNQHALQIYQQQQMQNGQFQANTIHQNNLRNLPFSNQQQMHHNSFGQSPANSNGGGNIQGQPQGQTGQSVNRSSHEHCFYNPNGNYPRW